MSADIWDEFSSSGSWIEFKEVGDKCVGTIKAIRRGTDFNGNPCPELVIDVDGEGDKTLTASQVMLKAELAAIRPHVGERIAIVYSGIGEAKPGKAPAKLFDVTTKAQEIGTPTGGVSAEDLL